MNKLKDLFVYKDEEFYRLRIVNDKDWSREIAIREEDDMENICIQLRYFVEGIERDIEDGN